MAWSLLEPLKQTRNENWGAFLVKINQVNRKEGKGESQRAPTLFRWFMIAILSGYLGSAFLKSTFRPEI